jgi:hypothetical protein
MRIQSKTKATIFWRAFNPDDTSYIVGLKEGTISPNQYVDFNHPTKAMLKVEIKLDNIHGLLILSPGHKMPNDGGIELYDDHITIQKRVYIPDLFKGEELPTVSTLESKSNSCASIKAKIESLRERFKEAETLPERIKIGNEINELIEEGNAGGCF